MLRRLLRFVLGIIIGAGVGIILLGLLAYLLRDQIWLWTQKQLSSHLSARITLENFSVDGWRGFPALTLNLYGLTLTTFEGDTLFTSQRLSVYLNFYEALVQKRYRIIGLGAETPCLRLHWDKAGQSAWNTIFRPSTDTTATTWHIQKVSVRGGRLVYTDEKSRVSFVLDGLHLGASLSHTPLEDTTWSFEARIQTTLQNFSTSNFSPSVSFPFDLQAQGAYLGKNQKMLIKSLCGSFYAFRLQLGGYLQWAKPPLYISLSVGQLDIDFPRLAHLWPRLPQEWLDWPGQISAVGSLQGFIGQGHLPNIDLKAILIQQKTFKINDYDLHNLYAKVRFRWHPMAIKDHLLLVDSLYLRGHEDSLLGRGGYTFSTRTWAGEVQGYLNLSALGMVGLAGLRGKAQGKAAFEIGTEAWHMDFQGRLDSLYYDTLTMASYEGYLSLASDGASWPIQARGQLRGLTYAALTIHRADLRWTPEALTLSQVKAHYGEIAVEAPILNVQPGREPWREDRLYLFGYLHLPRLPFPLPLSQGGETTTPTLLLNLQIAADTLVWQQRRYGPLRASLQTSPDTLTLQLNHLSGFANGILQGKLQMHSLKDRALWLLQLQAQNLHIPSLRADLPVLDSLFPLLPYLQGELSTEVQASLPFSGGGSLLWPQAHAIAHLNLKNFVVRESPYTYKLFSILPLTDFKRIQVGQVQTRFSLRDGVIKIDTTLLHANEWRLWVSGSHTLKNDLAYQLLVEVPRNLLLRGNSQVAEIVEEEEGERLRLLIRVTGKAEDPAFHWQLAPRASSKSPRKRPSYASHAHPSQQETMPAEPKAPAHPPSPARPRAPRAKTSLPVEESPR